MSLDIPFSSVSVSVCVHMFECYVFACHALSQPNPPHHANYTLYRFFLASKFSNITRCKKIESENGAKSLIVLRWYV